MNVLAELNKAITEFHKLHTCLIEQDYAVASVYLKCSCCGWQSSNIAGHTASEVLNLSREHMLMSMASRLNGATPKVPQRD